MRNRRRACERPWCQPAPRAPVPPLEGSETILFLCTLVFFHSATSPSIPRCLAGDRLLLTKVSLPSPSLKDKRRDGPEVKASPPEGQRGWPGVRVEGGCHNNGNATLESLFEAWRDLRWPHRRQDRVCSVKPSESQRASISKPERRVSTTATILAAMTGTGNRSSNEMNENKKPSPDQVTWSGDFCCWLAHVSVCRSLVYNDAAE